ncbi:MAG: carboxypeptidase-like regulatory domain-containing protein [Bacteroidota bacterium]
MKKLFLMIPANLFYIVVIAQAAVSGKVVEANTLRPVAAASVFVNNSSAGTSTGNNGTFILTKLPGTVFTLVVSCIGYETFIKEFQADKNGANILIELKHKNAELDAVIVTPEEKNGWINWGDLFMENFIGTSSYARGCRIKNPEVLQFRRKDKDNILTVSASEPLTIENKLLGYTIRYDLKEFVYYFSTNTVRYSGYALFEDMASGDNKMVVKYGQNRMKVYAVSLMHFIRSLYNETTEAEGFRIIRKLGNSVVEIKKKESDAVQLYSGIEKYDTVYEISNTDTQIRIIPLENAATHKDDFSISDKSSMRSIIHPDNENMVLNFTDTLQVIYTKVTAPYEYMKYATGSRTGNIIVSEISLDQQRQINIRPNGSFQPAHLVMNGFWGWWEKISIMLPFDYQPF